MYHVPWMIQKYGNIKVFTGHGVEKINDLARKFHHRKSNRYDATTDVMLAMGRQNELEKRGRKRQKRAYTKSNEEWWTTGNTESRSKRTRHSVNSDQGAS